ncbi:cyclase family protein [Megasphaera hominis]|uniref:Cyclase family protein n=1 Tax=Megasphaera hominis TaxID=159836 RepID=A0ABR6VHT2_9FIRM|nr:cyclase family protein [uncultured Megasphaera sp.]MBC3536287.1 cyclase family protein [Megasphaera hominis]MBC3536290.1 cyclase family protein [Megasphaera hominis]
MNTKDIAQALNNMEAVDLTLTMEEGMPVWPTHQHFFHNIVESTELGDPATHYAITMGEHCGTHMDAPRHFITGATPVSDVPVKQFMGHAVKIEATQVGPLGLFHKEDIMAWEKDHVEIQKDDIVLLHFGWDARYGVKPNYDDFLKDWPGLAQDGAQYLAEKGVKIVGCDALALDVFAGTDPTHKTLLPKGILIVENLYNLGLLPDEVFFVAVPLKIKDGSGSPVHAVAFFEKK